MTFNNNNNMNIGQDICQELVKLILDYSLDQCSYYCIADIDVLSSVSRII